MSLADLLKLPNVNRRAAAAFIDLHVNFEQTDRDAAE